MCIDTDKSCSGVKFRRWFVVFGSGCVVFAWCFASFTEIRSFRVEFLEGSTCFIRIGFVSYLFLVVFFGLGLAVFFILFTLLNLFFLGDFSVLSLLRGWVLFFFRGTGFCLWGIVFIFVIFIFYWLG